MKIMTTILAVAAMLFATAAQAESAVQAGEWEVTEKTSMEGLQPMPSTSKKVCLKAGDAFLERLLFPAPEEMKAHGCTLVEGPKKAGALNATLTCPASDIMAGVTAKAEITYTSATYQGRGQLEAQDKSGSKLKGSSELSGKRLGDCSKE